MNLELTAVIYNYQKYRRVSGCRIRNNAFTFDFYSKYCKMTKKERINYGFELAQSTELTTSFQSILWLIICTKQMTLRVGLKILIS
jgi:hypothetical protein